jgi:hypothetical protein
VALAVLCAENNKLTDLDNNLFNLLDTNPYLEVLAEGNPLKNPLGSTPRTHAHQCVNAALL